MNKSWSDLNKQFQTAISKKTSFDEGIQYLLTLRQILMNDILKFKDRVEEKAYALAPLIKSSGYENKTIAYSLYHIFRIEDIVCNLLILNKESILETHGFQAKLQIPIKTTGNELSLAEVVSVSQGMNITVLYEYIESVYRQTNEMITHLTYQELKRTFTLTDVQTLRTASVVSPDERSSWLVNYWCSKDVKGLLKMPFSRHWIMHIEAANRIADKIKLKNT